jgi:hypothetical protein
MDEHRTLTDVSQQPEFEIRCKVEKNSRSINSTLTTSIRWSGTPEFYTYHGLSYSIDAALADLLARARLHLEAKIQLAQMEESHE